MGIRGPEGRRWQALCGTLKSPDIGKLSRAEMLGNYHRGAHAWRLNTAEITVRLDMVTTPQTCFPGKVMCLPSEGLPSPEFGAPRSTHTHTQQDSGTRVTKQACGDPGG